MLEQSSEFLADQPFQLPTSILMRKQSLHPPLMNPSSTLTNSHCHQVPAYLQQNDSYKMGRFSLAIALMLTILLSVKYSQIL